jgi:uncharacterized protein with FMN-binding domain
LSAIILKKEDIRMKRKRLFGVICAAALMAVLAACVYEDGGEGFVPPVTLPAEVSVLPEATATFTPGTQRITFGPATSAETRGIDGGYSLTTPIVLDVTFETNRIAGIDLVSHGESTYGVNAWFFRAYPMTPDWIVVHQSTQGIDVASGGTVTQNAIIAAVNQAIELAGADPAALIPQIPAAPLGNDRFIPGMQFVYIPAGTYVVANPDEMVRPFELVALTPENIPQLGTGGPEAQRIGILHGGLRRYRSVEQPLGAYIATAVPHGTAADQLTSEIQGLYEVPSYPHEATVTAGLARALNQTFGYNLAAGDSNPRYNLPRGLWMQISFGRNHFWVGEGAVNAPVFGSGLFGGGIGETVHIGNPQDLETIGNNTLGTYWWSQQAHLIVNDSQSTHNLGAVDTSSNATMSARGVRVAVETAMRAAGATNDQIAAFTPLAQSPFFREVREADGTVLIPAHSGRVDLPGFPGVTIEVGQGRDVIRVIWVRGATAETVPGWDAANWNDFRNAILFDYARTATNGGRTIDILEGREPMAGVAPEFSEAVINFIRDFVNANTLNNVDQTGRIGSFE